MRQVQYRVFEQLIMIHDYLFFDQKADLLWSAPRRRLAPDFWDFDISEMPEAICDEGDEWCYADDCGLLYEIIDSNRIVITAIINSDLDNLVEWGNDNLTAFEPEKATYTVVSRKRHPYDSNEHTLQTSKQVGKPLLNWMKQTCWIPFRFSPWIWEDGGQACP